MDLDIEEKIRKELERVRDQLDVELTCNPAFKKLISEASDTFREEIVATPTIIVTNNGRSIQILAEGKDTANNIAVQDATKTRKLVSVIISLDEKNLLVYDEAIGELRDLDEFERVTGKKIDIPENHSRSEACGLLSTQYTHRVFDSDGIEWIYSNYSDSLYPLFGRSKPDLVQQVLAKGRHCPEFIDNQVYVPTYCNKAYFYSLVRDADNLGIAHLIIRDGITGSGKYHHFSNAAEHIVAVHDEHPHLLSPAGGGLFTGTETVKEKNAILEQQRENFRKCVINYERKSQDPETFLALEARVNGNTKGR